MNHENITIKLLEKLFSFSLTSLFIFELVAAIVLFKPNLRCISHACHTVELLHCTWRSIPSRISLALSLSCSISLSIAFLSPSVNLPALHVLPKCGCCTICVLYAFMHQNWTMHYTLTSPYHQEIGWLIFVCLWAYISMAKANTRSHESKLSLQF